MVHGLRSSAPDAGELLRSLDGAIAADPRQRRSALLRLHGRIQVVAHELRRAGRRDAVVALRLRESVLALLEGLSEQALHAAREAWGLVNGRQPPHVQALVLTQLGACLGARRDLRGAVRAARRAEALLVASCGEGLPEVLAVRAQLHDLLARSGQETALARGRLERTWRILGQDARDLAGVRRHAELRETFLGAGAPPHWALLFHQGGHLLRRPGRRAAQPRGG